ncbi:MAG: hypothetical protein GXY76_14190 [Chloroflexi bacterium]|nr:hypothetical protein [Chloroflexota bacterium]
MNTGPDRINRRFERFFDPRIPLLFLLGLVLTAVLGNAVYDWLLDLVSTPWLLAVLALVALVLLVLAYAAIGWLRERLGVGVVMSDRQVDPRPGLIVLVSQGAPETTSAAAAIRYHCRGERDERAEPTLRYLWLLAGAATGLAEAETPESAATSMANAERLAAQHRPLLRHAELVSIGDIDDPQQTFEAVEGIYREAKVRFGLREQEIIADFTGGTKSMTAGMVLACTPRERDLQFMKPRRYLPDGRADLEAGSEPRFVDVSFSLRGGED